MSEPFVIYVVHRSSCLTSHAITCPMKTDSQGCLQVKNLLSVLDDRECEVFAKRLQTLTQKRHSEGFVSWNKIQDSGTSYQAVRVTEYFRQQTRNSLPVWKDPEKFTNALEKPCLMLEDLIVAREVLLLLRTPPSARLLSMMRQKYLQVNPSAAWYHEISQQTRKINYWGYPVTDELLSRKYQGHQLSREENDILTAHTQGLEVAEAARVAFALENAARNSQNIGPGERPIYGQQMGICSSEPASPKLAELQAPVERQTRRLGVAGIPANKLRAPRTQEEERNAMVDVYGRLFVYIQPIPNQLN